jgi:ketosteroid isomerase-like protein
VNQYETRELCEQFFDAYQDGRVDVLRRIMSDDCIVWHNVFLRDTTRDENLEAYPNSYGGQRRRTYNDRTIDAWDDGFVIQYSLDGVMANGHKGSMPIRIVGRCSGGKITRIDEYMDTARFPKWLGTEGKVQLR